MIDSQPIICYTRRSVNGAQAGLTEDQGMKAVPWMDDLDKDWNRDFEAFLEGLPDNDVLSPEQEQRLESFLNDLPGGFGQDKEFVKEVMARIF